MNKPVSYIVVGLLLLLALLAAGPTIELDKTLKPSGLSKDILSADDIDKFIRNNEQTIADIRPGTEKTIIWANQEHKVKTHISIVYLHGFSATRQEVSPLCDLIAQRFGANLYYTRMTGHGRDNQAMANTTVNTLINDAVHALEIGRKIGDKVILIGTSTGGTQATWLASNGHSDSLLAVILMSPNFALKRSEAELMLLPWGDTILRLVEGRQYQFKPVNETQARYWTTEYPSEALLPMMGLVKLTRNTALENISTPTLVLYSPHDKIIDIDTMKENVLRFGSKIKHLKAIDNVTDPQQHVLAGEILSPQSTEVVAKEIEQFIKRLL